MPKNTKSRSGGININDVNGGLTVSGAAVGRDKNIITIQYINGTMSPQKEMEFFAKQIGLDQTGGYAIEKSKAYSDTWQSLQSLRLAGDDLWGKANPENLLAYSTQLRKTKQVVFEGEIFFEERDRKNLLQLLTALAKFQIGKEQLIGIRTRADAEEFADAGPWIIRQIEDNGNYKRKYETRLDQVRISFKARLSNKSA